MSCNCIIKDIPSVYCNSCGELQCICSTYFKCDSCSYFSCDECTMNLLCGHKYCCLDCILRNEKSTCDNSCFFIRDVDATDDSKDDKGLLALIIHWRDEVGNESIISEWVMKFSKDIKDIKDNKYANDTNDNNVVSLQNLLNKLNKLITIINS